MTTTQILNHTLARRAVLAAAVSMIGLSAAAPRDAAQAQPPTPLVDVQVIDRETGEVAHVWRHAGKLYVAGQPGARYGLRVTNNTGGRVMAVMSVDGVNILNGETAAYDQDGYVFAPYQSYDINGWRKSDNEIAAFNFAPQRDSYAGKTGRPSDVGVIGVAVFRERVAAPVAVAPPVRRARPPAKIQPRPPVSAPADVVPPPPLPIPPVERRVEMPAPPVITQAPPAPSAAARAQAEMAQSADASSKLGTGHGAREWSSIVNVEFTRASAYPQFIYRVEYDSRARLIASGVIPRPLPGPPSPSPFPGNRYGYVPDPPSGR